MTPQTSTNGSVRVCGAGESDWERHAHRHTHTHTQIQTQTQTQTGTHTDTHRHTHNTLSSGKLGLPSAGRVLYTRKGTALRSLSSDHHPELQRDGADGAIPELWVSMGEPFSPPDSHPDTVARRMRELKQSMVQLKQELAEKRRARKAMSAKLKTSLTTAQRSTIEDRLDVIKREEEECKEAFTAHRAEFKGLKEKRSSSSSSSGAAGGDGGDGTRSRRVRKELISRLSKPNHTTKRVMARRNGSSKSKPVMCMGTSMDGLLDACSQALGMSRARRLFTIDGQPLAFEDIKRDMEVLVSRGEAYINNAAQKQEADTRTSFAQTINANKKASKREAE